MKKVVIKIGSLGVTDPQGGASKTKIARLMDDLATLPKQGYLPILVSSGAINSGKSFIAPLEEKKQHISWQQAASAVGQPILMSYYREALEKHQLTPAQMLVTHEDFKSRERFLNIRQTLRTLLENNILPIINENDTVSFKEITVGDNDQLAAMVAEACGADLLVLLTDADGLYDRDPKDPQARRLNEVDFADNFSTVKFATKTAVGRGGMETKIQAVRKLTPLGLDVILATFNADSPVTRALTGQGGTLFHGDPRERIQRRKAWIATVVKPDCALVIDEGAGKALATHASLLPVGIRKVLGSFKRGDVVAIKHKNKTLAVGIVEYDHKEIELIKGKKSGELAALLTIVPSNVVIHRDNLFLKKD